MTKENRALPEEYNARLDIITGLIAKGFSQRDIVHHCLKKYSDWDVQERQLRNYYADALARMADEATTVNRAEWFTKTIHRLDFLYGQAVANGELQAARGALGDISKLLRLSNPQWEMDWRQAAKEAGLNPDDIWEKAIAQFNTPDE